jgi:dTDP-4-amino-4,6-dideoxygalactose transaminase
LREVGSARAFDPVDSPDNPDVPAPLPVRKSRWDELACLGGAPAFAEPLHVGRPWMPEKKAFLAKLDSIWDSRILTNNGPFAQDLEERFCGLLNCRHAVAVANATLGLQLAARAMGLEGKVIVPSFTFVATAHAIRWEGLEPAFCDVHAGTHTLDPDRVEEAIDDGVSAILGVHLWGNPCSGRLAQLADERGVRLIYDAAHAIGCDLPAGSLGEASIYSLHATKMAHGFEGGIVATDSDLLAHRLRSLRNFGFAGYDDVRGLGTNAKMNEASAAMALCTLDELPMRVERNREAWGQYQSALTGLPGIELARPAYPKGTNAQYVVASVDQDMCGLSRDQIVSVLWAENVRARRYFFPGCHRSEPYLSEAPEGGWSLPVTDELCQSVFVLPTGESVGQPEIQAIASILETAVAASRRIADLGKRQAA